jgi:hypothetical protein
MVTPPPAPPHKRGEFPHSWGEGPGRGQIKLINNLKIKEMKQINIILQIVVIAGLLLLTSYCNELPFAQTPTDKTPPSPVTNVEAISIPGGAKITYNIPASDDDISYVKAVYNYKGEQWTVRTSVYSDTLTIEGLGVVEPTSATLFVVDHSENISSGVSVGFTPLTPPIETIFESMQMSPDFGGVRVSWKNETNTEIGITIFIEDSTGVMRESTTQFSKEKQGEITFRGYDPKEYHFAARIVDIFDNVSDMKDARVTPLVESSLDKSKFLEVALPGDNTTTTNGRPLRLTWDNSLTTIWVTALENSPYTFPEYFTIDLGITAQLSRFKAWTRQGFYYNNYAIRTFEVWGAKVYKPDMPESYWTGSEWKNDWEKLGDFEIKRPSGSTEPTGSPTGVDLEAAQKGFEFLIPFEAQTMRYVRFVVNTIWSAGDAMVMAEFEFFGDNTIEQ